MRVLGLDPGSQKLGWGLLERFGRQWKRLDSGTIRLDPRRPLPERLRGAHEAASKLLADHSPDLVAVEECFVAASPKAALVLGQVRGVLLLAVEQAAIRTIEFSPRSIKLATVGNGGAAKEQVQYMVPKLILECPTRLGPDEADALAVAWCGALHAGASATLASTESPARMDGAVRARSPGPARGREEESPGRGPGPALIP